jgi:hypothetical protein
MKIVDIFKPNHDRWDRVRSAMYDVFLREEEVVIGMATATKIDGQS